LTDKLEYTTPRNIGREGHLINFLVLIAIFAKFYIQLRTFHGYTPLHVHGKVIRKFPVRPLYVQMGYTTSHNLHTVADGPVRLLTPSMSPFSVLYGCPEGPVRPPVGATVM
jgi:hypothetical protein